MYKKPAHGKDLYIITDGDNVKIGRANNSYKRVESLQSGNPRQIWLTDVFRDKGHEESKLHKQLKPFRLRGEWFRLTDIVKSVLQDFRDRNPQKIDIDDE